MKNEVRHIAWAALLAALTFPSFSPEIGLTIDGSCAWLYNYLFDAQRADLSSLLFPHGPLDFLQTPLPVGHQLEAALLFQGVLNFLFAWSGLRLAALWNLRYPVLQLLWLGLMLQFNHTGVLLFATTAHGVLYAIARPCRWHWAGAIVLTAVGLLIKTVIGMPGLFMLSAASIRLAIQHRQPLYLTLPGWVLVAWWTLWSLIFGGSRGFLTMLEGTFYLMQGNSAAVCHYPPNNWLYLGIFLTVWMAWPFFTSRKDVWWLLLLPAFAFWKYGISREDIWHLDVSFRFFVWAFGCLIWALPAVRVGHILAALAALAAFYANLKHAEGWSPPSRPDWRWENAWEWAAHFSEKKAAAMAAGQERLNTLILPDSVRHIIGDQTVEIYPWHHTWAAANGLHLRPRPIPQSYAAYHPWLDAQDAAFFSSPDAPDFLLLHLKSIENGNQLAGLDDRYLPHDEPATWRVIADRYRVRVRHERFLLLEKTDQHFLGRSISLPFKDGWQKALPDEPGIVRIKTRFSSDIWTKIKGMLYKEDPVQADVRCGNITRRIKIVPRLATEGLWAAPWIEQPSHPDEAWHIPDEWTWIMPDGTEATDMEVEWTALDPASGLLPNFSTARKATTDVELFYNKEVAVAPPDGYSQGWTQQWTAPPASDSLHTFEVQAALRGPHNSGCAQLVLALSDTNGKTLHYASTEYCAMGISHNAWQPTGLRTILPAAIHAPFTAKVYVWNTGSRPVKVKDLRIHWLKISR